MRAMLEAGKVLLETRVNSILDSLQSRETSTSSQLHAGEIDISI